MKEARTSLTFSLPKSLTAKVRYLVDTMPAQTLSRFIESLLEREVDEYESKYGPLEYKQDLYFGSAKKLTKSK